MADRHVTPFNDPSHQATYRHRGGDADRRAPPCGNLSSPMRCHCDVVVAARHRDVVAIRRRERARIRREKGIRWGGRPLTSAV
ncbi:hypothetical protein [Streptomyces sp. NPDC056713]|uniref:hypothetical protein n=1 Tax=Streptomyces sp. NPDC056713 TaxID=3345921 RepID=UPI00367849DE